MNKLLLFSLIILLYLTFSVPKLDNDFSIEEEYFVMVANNVNQGRGVVIQDGQEFKVFDVHPPFYVYVLALSLRLFKSAEFAARIIGLICTLFTGVLVYILAKKLISSEAYSLIAMLIFLISPFVIQSGLMVDINGSILLFLIVLFMVLYIFNKHTLSIIVLTLVLWAKIEGFLFIILSFIIMSIFSKDKKRAIMELVSLIVYPIFFFMLTWAIVAYFIGADFFHPFTYLFTQSIDLSGMSVFMLAWFVKTEILWVGLPLIIATALFTVHIKDKNFQLVLIYSWIVFVFFTFLLRTQFGFPKYIISIMPFFSIAFAGYLKRKLDVIRPKFVLIILILIAGFIALIFGDQLYISNFFYSSFKHTFSDYIFSSIMNIVYILIIPFIVYILIIPLIAYTLFVNREINSIMPIILIISYLAISLATNSIQVLAEYSTTQGYGRVGMKETGNYLNSITTDNDILLTERDVGYYSGRAFFRIYPVAPEELTEISSIIANNPKYFSAVVISPSTDQHNRDLVKQQYKFDRKIGIFEVFR